MYTEPDYTKDRAEASQWAKELLADDFIVLDTETTGLTDAEIVQLTVIDSKGNTLLNCLLKPDNYTEWSGAEAIHGISPDMVKNAPSFSYVIELLAKIIKDRRLIIYNKGYDWTILERLAEEYSLPGVFQPASVECAMLQYAAFYGDWNDYRKNYKWQKLAGGDHSALGDCLATIEVIRKMAQAE